MTTISFLIAVYSLAAAAAVAGDDKIINRSSQFLVSKLCRDKFSTAAKGAIQPLVTPVINYQECSFIIEAPADQLILRSCSVVNLTSPDSELIFYGGAEIDVNPPVAKSVYTSRGANIYVFSQIDSNRDWFDCQWTTTPTPQATAFKLLKY